MTAHASPRTASPNGQRRTPGRRRQPADARHREYALWRLPALGRAGRARRAGRRDGARLLAAKRVSVILRCQTSPARRPHRRARAAGFAAAAIEAAKQDRDDARQNYLLRRVAVAGFAAMNIMLLSVAVWSGTASDMDPALASAVPLAVGADRAAHGRLCRAAVFRLGARRAEGPPPQHGRADLARHSAGDRNEPLSDHARQRAGLFRCRRVAAVLPAGRPLSRRALRVRARSEAQNLLSLQSGMATVIEPDGAQRKVAGACAAARRSHAGRGRRDGSPPTAWCWNGTGQVDQSLITGETAPLTVSGGRGGLCRHAQPDAAAADRGHAPPTAQRCSPRSAG